MTTPSPVDLEPCKKPPPDPFDERDPVNNCTCPRCTNSTGDLLRDLEKLKRWMGSESDYYLPIVDRAISALSHPMEGRWIEWKPGDALPDSDARYLVSCFSNHNHARTIYTIDAWRARDGKSWDVYGKTVVAYWSIPLPPPYKATT